MLLNWWLMNEHGSHTQPSYMVLNSQLQGTVCGRVVGREKKKTASEPEPVSPLFQYFYDVKRARCFPFEYSGCGGNANNFPSVTECKHECMPDKAESRDCGGKKLVKGLVGRDCEHKFCPKGSDCFNNGYFAYCCK
ncbi:Kunitz/Bovine pancreatic trypsin inhibitor domain protein [Teladorsagia circumcincta]|uniref:Kunitz/Bovine pancreatic trypsin inhibitor domain protein n=1 Tax=Teladorsagia circumcincta TaxID=45464 RepID=A0A2G9UBF9_TELCI|nr:Kunitz/Bovine pancreatic trypsin inhibitor domain protein [Teladorsagia circumcincta]